MNSKTKRANNQVNSVMNEQEQREMVEKANRIVNEMKSFTWRDLETHGKFNKNDKLSFISDDMLILGCDIGSEVHYVRAIDTRAGNPLQKMQSLIVIACKLLRVIYTMLKTGKTYDPEKLLKDIRYPENVQTAAA